MERSDQEGDMRPSGVPLMIYNGDCRFCRRWIERWRRWTGERMAYAPSKDVAADFPQIPEERFRKSVVLIEPDGRVTYGAEAVARALAVRTAGKVPLWIYEHVPGARRLSEAAYRYVADGRGSWPFT